LRFAEPGDALPDASAEDEASGAGFFFFFTIPDRSFTTPLPFPAIRCALSSASSACAASADAFLMGSSGRVLSSSTCDTHTRQHHFRHKL
jgi:hypothetical protein